MFPRSEMFSAADLGRFERQWAKAVEAPERSMSVEDIADAWRFAVAFPPSTATAPPVEPELSTTTE